MQTAVTLCKKKEVQYRYFTQAKTHHEGVFKGSSLPTVHLQILSSDESMERKQSLMKRGRDLPLSAVRRPCSGSRRSTGKTLISVLQTDDRWKV